MDVFEEGVRQGLMSSDSLGRNVIEHLGEEIDQILLIFHNVEHLGEVFALVRREGIEERLVEYNFLFEISGFGGCERSQRLEYFEELISLCFPPEKGHLQEEFCQDAPCRPDVDSHRVIADAQDELGSPIVSGNNVRGVLALLVDDLAAAEIADFDYPCLG